MIEESMSEQLMDQYLGNAGQRTLALEPFDGLLCKYTNVVKGWCYRWFVLTPSRCTLEYYTPEERKKSHPRGCIYLGGAVISPSEEDGLTFTVSSATGETFKLKASDVNERRMWVNKIRQVAEAHHSAFTSYITNIDSQLSDQTKSSLNDVRNMLIQAQKYQRSIASDIENFTCNDANLLTLKSLTASTAMSLEQCYVILNSIERRQSSAK